MDRLLRSIASFHAGHGRLLQPHLESLAQDGQRPQVMVVTCADSRILLDPLVNSEPGIVFAVRNVGNLVPDDDEDHSVAAAVEYAIHELRIPDIVVMGHAECGAMKAMLGERIEGPIGGWLRYADATLERLEKEPGDEAMPDYDRLSQKNALIQAERLRAMPSVAASGTNVHAWWWDMANAQVLGYDGERFVSLAEAYAPETKPRRGLKGVLGGIRERKPSPASAT